MHEVATHLLGFGRGRLGWGSGIVKHRAEGALKRLIAENLGRVESEVSARYPTLPIRLTGEIYLFARLRTRKN
jgi:hypothetical protein